MRQPPSAPTRSNPQRAPEAPIADRRGAPRRRLRDRIASLDGTDSPALRARPELANLVLLLDDDLRQTALALGAVESYLSRSMALVEQPSLTPAALSAHAEDEAVLEQLETLSENMTELRRRMLSIAAAMK